MSRDARPEIAAATDAISCPGVTKGLAAVAAHG